jgi:membrane-associated phospholipid phosphatase/predicted MFS family arabinose efflux permease
MTAIAPAVGLSRPAGRRLLAAGLLPLVAFAAAALGAGIGRAVTTSYLPLLLERIKDAPGLIGMVMLVNAFAGFGIPLVVGIWSDRMTGRGRRTAFILGGGLLTGGGLAAVALGSGTSYLFLAAAGAVVYIGLNAVTTVHRALVPESFPLDERPRATSAQELSLLIGGLIGIAIGGALTDIAVWAPFALAAVLVPLLALPTVAQTRNATGEAAPRAERTHRSTSYYFHIASKPGVRGFLVAQILWVLGYAALPAFFLLFAEEELGLRPAVASLWLAGFGIATAAAIVGAGRVRKASLQRPMLLAGVALMGTGFLGVAASTSLIVVGPALMAGAIGFGLISTLGFPLFSQLIPEGEEGGYSALYFSVRAISSTIALPTAGWLIAVTGTYRTLFVLGGIVTLAALVPLTSVRLPRLRRGRGVAALGAVWAAILALGIVTERTRLQGADEWLFQKINGLGPGPDWVWTTLDPHTRNYVVLIALAVGLAAVTSLRSVPRVFAQVMGAALLSWGLLEALYALNDRPRPEEALGASEVSLNGHSWAHLHSFPSGHMAITAALAVAIALAFPRLRWLLWGYVAAVAFTRVMFGAHFPLDVLAGTALGAASAYAVVALVARYRSRAATTLSVSRTERNELRSPA